MNSSGSTIDDQIEEEIKRIARDVIDWDKSTLTESGYKPHWKPRFDTEGFRVEQNGIIPIVAQVYYDLQLSRGSSGNEKPDLQWDLAI